MVSGWRLETGAMYALWAELRRRFRPGALPRVEAMLVGMCADPPAIPEGRGASLFWLPDLASRPWWSRTELPQLDLLEEAAIEVARELDMVGDGFRPYIGEPPPPDPRPGATPGLTPPELAWTAFFFCRDGRWSPRAAELAPRTAALLDRLDVGPGDAMFSALAPRSEIVAHRGLHNLTVTAHLGLQIPGGCALEVAGEARTWSPGKTLAFDDTWTHRAWNRADSSRTILLVDLWHPGLTADERRALAYLLPRLRRLARA